MKNTHARTSSWGTVACLLAFVLVLVGCDGGSGGSSHVEVVLGPPQGGDIEGYAFFPYEDALANYPVYFDTGNELILVTVYDWDDLFYEFPLASFVTDTSGFFLFIDVLPDIYYLTAEAQEYDPVFDITYFYWAETPDFDLDPLEIVAWELFLELDASVAGKTQTAQLFEKLVETGKGEVRDVEALQQFHRMRTQEFTDQGKVRGE